MTRWFGLVAVAILGLVAGFGCGGDDSSLVEIGDEVQATLIARATVNTLNLTLTPQPTPTPEPQVLVDQRALVAEVRGVRNLFAFLAVRLATEPGAIGSLADEQGNLAAGWLESCCPQQLDAATDASSAAASALADVRASYEAEGTEEHLTRIAEAEAQFAQAQASLDAVPATATLAAARELVASTLAGLDLLDAAIDSVINCCEPPATPTPSPSATLEPQATP